jgi:hypothetical protein
LTRRQYKSNTYCAGREPAGMMKTARKDGNSVARQKLKSMIRQR